MDPEAEADRLASLQMELGWARLNYPDQLRELIRLAERELLLVRTTLEKRDGLDPRGRRRAAPPPGSR